MEKTICELFAGVGGFRLGMERLNTGWRTTWFSQWEPGKVNQWAHDCYVAHFGDLADSRGEYHTGEDISLMKKECIPNHNLLVGGFPCQDYSVAHALASAQGIEGKKGVLWWQIRDTIIAKNPAFCIFENVDRLLKSPANQRGRDFGIILACLARLNYSVEWRIVNAATYGAAQRRRRTFIFAYRNDTVYGRGMSKVPAESIILQNGFMTQAFPITRCLKISEGDLGDYATDEDIINISDQFEFPFEKAGYMYEGHIYTCDVIEEEIPPILLRDILEENVDEEYYITEDKKSKWVYLKGAKKIPRKTKDGHEYTFSEGPVAFPDPWDRPGRTMLTSESTLNRSTHVVTDPGTGRLRLITPIEAERMQGFDDGWTNYGMPSRMRYFCMGNALVVPMITRMGMVLDRIFDNEPEVGEERMDNSHFFHKEDLIHILENVLNKTLGEVDVKNVFARTIKHPKITGIAGDVIEQSVLGYPADREQRPDLNVDGVPVELKTTGMRESGLGKKKELVAKEPASITAVSIDKIASEKFDDSAFYHKIKNMLFVFYHYDSNVTVRAAAYANFYIRGYMFYQFSEDNLIIIRRDWQRIHDFIADIQVRYSKEEAQKHYPDLSTKLNKELVFLDTAPKYPHAPRIRLRRRVVTLIVQEKFGKNLEPLPDKYFGYKDVIEKCKAITALHRNQSMASILDEYKVQFDVSKKHKTKQFAELVIVRMFGGEAKKMSQISLFQTFGIIGKSIAITIKGTRTEDMKLFAVDFDELVEQEIEDDAIGNIREKTFEDSALYNYLSDNKLLCVVFREDTADSRGNIDLRENKFMGFKLLDLAVPELLLAARKIWEEARDKIINNKLCDVPILLKDGSMRYTPKTGIPMAAPNLPKSEDNIIFFRGSGKDAADKSQVVNSVKMLKQYYWIKGSYLVKKMKEVDYL